MLRNRVLRKAALGVRQADVEDDVRLRSDNELERALRDLPRRRPG